MNGAWLEPIAREAAALPGWIEAQTEAEIEHGLQNQGCFFGNPLTNATGAKKKGPGTSLPRGLLFYTCNYD
jgi:hypothetical protein